MRLCVFCGSSAGRHPLYIDAAQRVATSLARRGVEIVYGGGNVGLMKVVADTAIAPLQDVLGLDNSARMNMPATTGGNWSWRFAEGAITPALVKRLRDVTELFGRAA